MSGDGFPSFVIGVVCGAIWLAVVLTVLGAFSNEDAEVYRKQAIERGFAHYDAKTGEWQWNE